MSRPFVRPGSLLPLVLEALGLLYYVTHAPLLPGSWLAWWLVLGGQALMVAGTTAVALTRGLGTPLGVLAAQLIVMFWSTVADPALLPVRWLFSLALACQVGASLSGVRMLVSLALIMGELLLVTHGIPGMTQGNPDPWQTALIVVGLGLGAAVSQRVARESLQFRREREKNDLLHGAVVQLTEANMEFLGHAQTVSKESAVRERHRITRDLHDIVGQTLTNIIMMMDAALHRGEVDAEENAKLFRWVRKQAQTGLEETRAILYELRAVKEPSLRGVKALKKLVDTFSHLSGIKVHVHWGNLPWTFDPDQEHAVHHLVQATLSNAFRHGAATRIDVHFQVVDRVLHVMIRDNGHGGPVSDTGLGQRGMAERLAPWKGEVTFRSDKLGYTVTAQLPLVEVSVGNDEDTPRG